MIFSNVNDAISWLERQPRFREKTNLDYIKQAYVDLDINFDNIKKIHVGGTNGKGSTSAFVTQILIDNNLNVGTFTSPYLVKFNERIKINNIDIPDDILLDYINFFCKYNDILLENHNFKLSFFEIVTLISFKYFYDNAVDVIVIEVGIGGRLDATNILTYDVSVITSIGLDHINQLGSTLKEITYEKMNILKPNGFLVSAVEGNEKTQIINYANKIKAGFKFVRSRDIFALTPNSFYYLDSLFEISLLGDYQRSNALIAYETTKYLFNFTDEQIKPSLNNTKWPGRLEQVKKDVYLDGAHNIPAIESLMRNISYIFKDKKITILFSALKDKQIKEMLDIIKRYDNNIILTSFPDFRFSPLNDFEESNIKYIEGGIQVFNELIKNKEEDEIIVATGSLHFIGYLKQEM